MQYEPVIGLEVHVQLNTKSKMFGRVPYSYGQAPNTLTDPVVLALPGSLPVINLDAIKKTVKVGLLLNCKIADLCKWDRKNYFYPDLPKGYQISQFDQPLCLNGEVEIELPGPSRNLMGLHRKVKLNRIHLEEDVGKLSHGNNESLVDFNRAGTPLIEIVSEPDLYSIEEVFAFLTSLRIHLLYAGVSDCDMEKGQLRCDANVSVRPQGSSKLGTKVEIKNLNSISGVKNGVEYEIARQINCLQKNIPITQETRGWDASQSITYSMRSKEEANDYRYFPDPDLMPVKLSQDFIHSIQSSLPEAPFAKQERFFKQYDLPYTITSVLYPNHELSSYFEKTVQLHNNPKAIANLLINDILRELTNAGLSISDCKISPDHLAQLVQLIDSGTISKQIAQDVLIDMFHSGSSPQSIIQSKGLQQQSNKDLILQLCSEAIAQNPKAVQEFKAGKSNAINSLKGYVMKATKGQANPQIIDDTLKQLIS